MVKNVGGWETPRTMLERCGIDLQIEESHKWIVSGMISTPHFFWILNCAAFPDVEVASIHTHKWKNPNPFVHLCYALLRYRRVFVRLGSQIQQIPSVRWPCSDGWLVGSWRRGAELTIDVDRWISSGCGCCLQDHPSWHFWYVFGMKVWLQLVIGIAPWIRCPRDLNHLPGMPSNRDVPWSQWLVINVSS